jgi:hypothetical protein
MGSTRLTYCDLKDELVTTVVRLESVQNRRKLVGIEFDYEMQLESSTISARSSNAIFSPFACSGGSGLPPQGRGAEISKTTHHQRQHQ